MLNKLHKISKHFFRFLEDFSFFLSLSDEKYPALQILGGIDKMAIARGKAAIDAELEWKLPLMKRRGGYIVSLDHRVNPEISLENYQYFIERG